MKSVLSICLVLSMGLQSFFQLSTIAYYQLNTNEIEAQFCVNKDQPELCCKGKCYISKQLDFDGESHEQKETNEIKIPVFQVSEVMHCKLYVSFFKLNAYFNLLPLSSGYLSVLEQPPIA